MPKSTTYSTSAFGKYLFSLIYFSIIALGIPGCKEHDKYLYKYSAPEYRQIKLVATRDTIKIPVTQSISRSLRSIRYISDNQTDYLTYYDKNTHNINVYDFNSMVLIKSIDLKKYFPNIDLKKNAAVYYKSFDSLLIINDQALYLIDRSLSIKDSIAFQLTTPGHPIIEQAKPPYFSNGLIYLAAKLKLATSKKNQYRKWKTLYEVDLKKKETRLVYSFPEHYRDSLYGFHFFKPTYCANEKGNIVISFPADTNLYETNLKDYFIAYNSKSIDQHTNIPSATSSELTAPDGFDKSYAIRDSYTDVFYDPYNKIYMRIAEHKMTEKEFILGKKFKNKSVIFLNDDLRIVGESELDPNIVLATIFFTRNKKIYARTNIRDKDTIYFIRLEYKSGEHSNQLASKSVNP